MNTNETTYVPHPVDTSHIDLPEELVALVDALAKNTHDVWAAGRIAEGFSYGPERDDTHHPDLKPYEELTQAEKAYDVATATETIKLLLAWGWQLVPPTE